MMIEVRELTKRYGRTKALDGLTFDVVPGRVTGFLGPNGAGKSTTMRVILGLDAQDSGWAFVNGVPYRDLAWPLREVGALLDARAFHPGRSARSHLLSMAQANAIGRERVATVLQLVGLTSVARKRAGTFSLGMAQRLNIAAALLGDPGILLFDEPINGLDPDGVRWFRGLIAGLAGEGRAVLLSSHLISEMELSAEHLIVIGKGRLITELSMNELLARAPRSIGVRTPDPDGLSRELSGAGMRVSARADGSLTVVGGDADEIASRAVATGIAIHELTPERASLEDVYMELTHSSAEYLSDRSYDPAPSGPSHANTGRSS